MRPHYLLRPEKVETALGADSRPGMHPEAAVLDLEGMRSDAEFEISQMTVQTATRSNDGSRRFEARVVDAILALLDAARRR